MSRLHVDRPGKVRPAGNRWVWTCWLCPLPLCDHNHEAPTALAASWAAHAHIEADHGHLARGSAAA